jgi:NET1-associated nuclear protein 1 (U3 small nucleolar RNA-associated protein 17)
VTCGGAGDADHVQQIVFVPGTPFMVVATQAGIFAWNLLTCSLWYSYWLPHPVLAAHPGNGKFVVVATVDDEVRYRLIVLFFFWGGGGVI